MRNAGAATLRPATGKPSLSRIGAARTHKPVTFSWSATAYPRSRTCLSRVPVHSTAIGHAIVGFLPRAEQERILAAAPGTKMTDRTVTDVKTVLQRFKQVREGGHAGADQENVTG